MPNPTTSYAYYESMLYKESTLVAIVFVLLAITRTAVSTSSYDITYIQ